jgi:hypothetical protein
MSPLPPVTSFPQIQPSFFATVHDEQDIEKMAELVPIPEPPGLPILGNVTSLNPEYPLGSMMELAEK